MITRYGFIENSSQQFVQVAAIYGLSTGTYQYQYFPPQAETRFSPMTIALG